MKEFLQNYFIVWGDSGWRGSILEERDDEALITLYGKMFGRSVSTYEKIIWDTKKDRLVGIKGIVALEMCVAAAKHEHPFAEKALGEIVSCVKYARLCR